MCIHNFVNVPLLCAIFSNDGPWSGQLTIREEEGVVQDVPLQYVGVEAGECVGVVG